MLAACREETADKATYKLN